MHRLLTEVGTSIGASAVMVVAILVGGQLVMTPATSAATGGKQPSNLPCLEEPLAPTTNTNLHAIAHLCLNIDGVQPTVELTGGTSGMVYTAWLAYLDRWLTLESGPCMSAQLAAQNAIAPPGQFDSAIPEQDGHAVLSRALPSLRPIGGSEIVILVVSHGLLSTTASAVRNQQLLAWDRSWSGLPAIDQLQGSSQLLGCAAFWIRGGAELTEH